VPNSGNLDQTPLVIHTVNDSVWSKDGLTDGRDAKFRNHSATLRLRLQYIGMCDEPEGERLGTLWAVTGDESNDVAQVVA